MTDAASDANEERRRGELRKAGEEYFAKVLAQSKAAADPLKAPPPPRRARDVESSADADLEAVGAVLEGARLYVLSALYIASQGASLVLLKSAIEALPTPALLVFLHSLPAALLMALLHCWGGSSITLSPLNLRTLKGSLPSIAFHSLQTLTAISALRHGSMYLVLGWTAFVPSLMQTQYELLRSGGDLSQAGQAGVAAGVGGLALVLATGRWPGFSTVLWLAAWAAVEAAQVAWQAARQRIAAGEPLSICGVPAEVLRGIADAEESISGAQCTFYKSAASALPALLLAFAMLEMWQLAERELSVPAFNSILLSMAAWGVSQVCGLMVLRRAAGPRHTPRLTLAAACAAVTLILQLVMFGVDRPGAMLGADAAVVGSIVLQMPPHRT